MVQEVAYFRYIRRLFEKNNIAQTTAGIRQVGEQLRPDIYAPNYEFYVPELVCWEHERPHVKWAIEYNRFTAEESNDLEAFTCVDDGLLDPVSFKRCPNCSGAFYDLFRHPYQTTAYHHCFSCLEAGSNTKIHPFYKQYTKLAPPDRLTPPVVTKEAVQKGEDEFWDNLQRLLDS